ncbi:MAG: N-acyl homoserine lactonase family protein [Ilumatobacteraceae bacterium]
MSSATVTALDCGWMETQERTLLQDGSHDLIRIPVPAWLVRHRDGDVVFDVGLHPSLADGSEALGRLSKLFAADLAADGSVGARLTQQQVDPAGPLTVVLSHSHFDHVGGLCELPNARVVVQRDEWVAAMSPDTADDHWMYDLGHDIVMIDGPHDVFGDDSVVCVPTPGHTCGHQSLQVRTDASTVLLTADACYFGRTLDDGVLPPFGFDLDQQRASLAAIRRERDRGTTIVPGHDADLFRSFQRI